MVLDRQCAIKAGKEFLNLVIGEEGHVAMKCNHLVIMYMVL